MTDRRQFLEAVAAMTAVGIVKTKGKRLIGEEAPPPVGHLEPYKADCETTPTDQHPRIWLDGVEITSSVQTITVAQEAQLEETTEVGDDWASFRPTGIRTATVELQGISFDGRRQIEGVGLYCGHAEPVSFEIEMPGDERLTGEVYATEFRKEAVHHGLDRWWMTLRAAGPVRVG